MPGTQRVRGKVNVVLNRLMREGVISGFRTNFDNQGKAASPHVTVTVAEGKSLEDMQVLVMNAVMEVAVGINVTVECA